MKKKAMVLLMSVVLMAGTVMGCGSGKDSGSKAQTETETQAVDSEESGVDEKTADEGGSSSGEMDLIAGATTGFFGAESLDVANGWDGWIMSIYGISENLFKLDENFQPQPWIAESYKNVDDTTWEFTIRDGVKFSNGKDVTAEAVKRCFERTYEQNDRADSTLKIESMEADGQMLTIKIPELNATLLNDLCDPLLGIYDADEEADPELGVVCTGPYAADSFDAMADVKMSANKEYWGGEPKEDKVELRIFDDEDALEMALQNGEIDLIAQASANIASLFANSDDFVVEDVTETRTNFLMYNVEHPGMDDQAVREAVSYCVDRDSFAEVVYQGYASPSYGIYPENMAFGGTEGLENSVEKYDPAQAKKVLEDAGYTDSDGDGILDKDGIPLSFKAITYSYNTECTQLADMLQAEFVNAGMELSIETFDVLDDSLAAGDFDIAILSHAMAPTGTAQYFVNQMFTTGGNQNFGGYSNEKVDSLAKKLAVETDADQTVSLTREICQEVLNDRAFDFVIHQKLVMIYSSDVSGVEVNPTEYYLITNTIEKN